MITLREWYKGVPLPAWGSQMEGFLIPSAGLLSNLLPAHVPVVFAAECETAFADRYNNRIVCGTSFLNSKESFRLNPLASKEEALTFGLALIAHEGSHFAWSPELLTDLLNPGVPTNDVTTTIANIVEDIYIEHRLIQDFPQLAWTIIGGWEYLFNPAYLESKGLPVWSGDKITKKNLQDVINYFITWKHQYRQFPMRSELEKEFYNLFLSACGMRNLQERKNLVERIIKKLKLHFEENQDPGAVNSLMLGDDRAKSSTFTSDGTPLSKDEVFKIRRMVMTTSDAGKSEYCVEVGSENEKQLFVVDMGRTPKKKLNYNKAWLRLAELANQRGAVRRINGQAVASGKNLTHPLNVKGNGKVFSNSVLQSTSGRIYKASPQIMVLVDFSGSMKGHNKIQNAISAAYGASVGTESAGIRFACYGYTTESGGVKIIKIKDFSEPASAAQGRLVNLYNRNNLEMNNTPDFEAISFVSKKFENDGGDKVLIVVSDGSPSYGKAGSSAGAVEDVRKLVEQVRQCGVQVFGMSVDAAADKSVKKIYGEKFSLCSTDPNAITKFVEYFI